jgi:hypothetical protein
MKGLDHSAHLREISSELVEVAERRAILKAEAAALKRARKSDAHAGKQKQLKARVRELSTRVQELINQIAQPPPRRNERWSGVLPVTLHVEARGRRFDHPASTLDMSDRGLRIVTTTSLLPGQTLDVYSNRTLLGHCRVVWVTGAGSDRPSEVGLEVLR